RNTNGVVAVDNRIAVGAGERERARDTAEAARGKPEDAAAKTESAVTDSWITTKVKSTLLLSSDVTGTEISVTTDGGVVKLAGDVDSTGERQYYIFRNDATGRLVAQHLLTAADRGVRVRLLLDHLKISPAEVALLE